MENYRRILTKEGGTEQAQKRRTRTAQISQSSAEEKKSAVGLGRNRKNGRTGKALLNLREGGGLTLIKSKRERENRGKREGEDQAETIGQSQKTT